MLEKIMQTKKITIFDCGKNQQNKGKKKKKIHNLIKYVKVIVKKNHT